MSRYDHIDFRPPKSVAEAAEKGLEYRKLQGEDKAGLTPEEASKEGIGSGVQRAVNLKNRNNISPKVIKQMVAFFSRHEKNKAISEEHKGEPWKDKGYVAWLIWGGDPGRAWAKKVLKQMEAADEKTASSVAEKWDLGTLKQLAERVAAASQDKEFLKSLLRIAKKGGAFASGRQAKFLWNSLNSRIYRHKVADQWGRAYKGNDPNAFAAAIMVRDSRFGVKDPSKIRYVAYLFVIDGAGIKAMARGDVSHPKGGSGTATLVGAKSTEFVRRDGAPVLYDHEAESSAQRARVEKNRGLIEKIKAVPGFDQNSFLRDMVDILESGRQLSPAQLGAVRKYLPDVGVGDPSEWKSLYEEGVQAIERNFIKPSVAFFRSDKVTDKDMADWYLDKVLASWKAFKAKPQIQPEMGDFTTLNGLAEDVGVQKQSGVTGFGDAMARLWIASKRGQKAPKTALRAIPIAKRYIEQFSRLSPSRVEYKLEEIFGGEPEPDPFDI